MRAESRRGYSRPEFLKKASASVLSLMVGDAVATEDFWRGSRGYFNCVDFALSAKSMDKIASIADLIVPGHDNYFHAK